MATLTGSSPGRLKDDNRGSKRETERKILGLILLAVGVLLMGFAAYQEATETGNEVAVTLWLTTGLTTIVIGILMFLGRLPKQIGKVIFDNGDSAVKKNPVPQKNPRQKLTEEQETERREYSKKLALPDAGAPKFRLLEESLALRSTPCADPMTPMYMLDSQYRIIDWNNAFALAFDRSMEGRRGQSVMEWVYFLDNYREVLENGEKAFSDPNNLPPIHVEEILYNSLSYGKVSGKKRAYRIPDDDGQVMGWLVTIELCFDDKGKKSGFYTDLLTSLKYGLMWSEYALSYDAVLNNTRVYPELIGTLIGEENSDLDIPAFDARILDLGAGTGNITKRLADGGTERLIVALDNNPMMMNILRSKCQRYLRQNDSGPGVIATRQDITSLFGLREEYFDFIFLNNVLYSLDEEHATRCLDEAFRVLKTSGEIRISGPKKNVNLGVLLKRFEEDLKKAGKLDELREQLEHVKSINVKYLQPMLHKWDAADIDRMLGNAGFKDAYYINEQVYAGQSRIVCARK